MTLARGSTWGGVVQLLECPVSMPASCLRLALLGERLQSASPVVAPCFGSEIPPAFLVGGCRGPRGDRGIPAAWAAGPALMPVFVGMELPLQGGSGVRLAGCAADQG